MRLLDRKSSHNSTYIKTSMSLEEKTAMNIAKSFSMEIERKNQFYWNLIRVRFCIRIERLGDSRLTPQQ